MCFGCRTKVLLMDEIILLYSNYIFHPETVCCSYREKYHIYYNILLCNNKKNQNRKDNDNKFDDHTNNIWQYEF